jgi:hypothetical protein
MLLLTVNLLHTLEVKFSLLLMFLSKWELLAACISLRQNDVWLFKQLRFTTSSAYELQLPKEVPPSYYKSINYF